MINKIFLFVFLLFLIITYGCGVPPKTASTISVSPLNATLLVGSNESFSSTCTFSDGTTSLVTAAWSVSPSSLGSIISYGDSRIFTASSEGSGTVIATYSGISGNATITITGGKTVSSITVSPSNKTAQIGSIETFTSAANYSDGTSAAITAVWSVSPTSLGTTSASGATCIFTGSTLGSGFLVAAYGGVSGNAVISVVAGKTLSTVIISPTSGALKVGSSETFSSSGSYSDGSISSITASWSIAPASLGTVISAGSNCLLTANNAGTGLLVATSEGKTASIPVVISP